MFEDRKHWADKAFWWVAPVVILASAGGGAYYYFHSRQKAADIKAKTASTPAAAVNAEPAIRHPLPASAAPSSEAQLPALNESDAPMREALENLFGGVSMQQALIPQDIVRHVVVTIDNLPRQKVAVEKRPLKPVPGQTAVATQGDLITLSDENFARYKPLVQLAQATDTQTLADLYFRFYPLFQKAYEDLGYPGQYFNDRLVEAIDSLLETPEISGPIALTQPRVFYEFADPKLEARSAGQKVLLRMGPANAAVVKAKLRELRKSVTSAGAEQGMASPPHGGMRHWL